MEQEESGRITGETEFTRFLVRAMKERGINTTELASKIGVSVPFVSQLRTGERRPGRFTVVKIATALGIPTEVFLQTLERGYGKILGEVPGEIPRKFPVLTLEKLLKWENPLDHKFPSLNSTRLEYGISDDPDAFWVEAFEQVDCIRNGDLLLIEPGKKVVNGNMVLAHYENKVVLRRIFFAGESVNLVSMNKQGEPDMISFSIGEIQSRSIVIKVITKQCADLL